MQKIIVIPARGGSKGIPRKNIYPINGKPLIEYTLDVIQKAALEKTDVVVSTDSDEIRAVVERYEKIYVVNRPSNISGDSASTESALVHAITLMEKKRNIKYDAVLTLQATSPLRKAETLRKFVGEYEKNYPAYDALFSLSESYSDYWIKNENLEYERLYKNAPRRRQDRIPLYIENSAYYITDADLIKKGFSVLGTRANGFIISEIEAIDINEKEDLIIAESFLNIIS